MTHRPAQTPRVTTILAVVVLVAAGLVGSVRPATAQDTATASPAATEAAAILEQATTAMAAVDSFHFTLTTPRGTMLFMENVELAGLEGDVQRPDRFHANATAKAAMIELSIEIIGVGTTLWVTDPLSSDGQYIEIDLAEVAGSDQDDLVNLLNPDRLITLAVDLIEEPEIVGEEELDGVATTVVEGLVDPSRIGEVATPMAGAGDEMAPLVVAIWIDGDGLVRRMELDGKLTAAEDNNVTRRLDLSAFNEPVTIEPPATT